MRSHARYRLLALAALGVLLLSFGAGLVEAQGGGVIRIHPSVDRLQVGQTAEIVVSLEGMTDLYAAEIHLTFDPSLIEVVDSNVEMEGVQVAMGDMPAPDYMVQNLVDNAQGRIDYAVTQLPPREPASGAGTLLLCTVRAKRAGTLRVQAEAILATNQAEEIDAQIVADELAIQGGVPVWLIVVVAVVLGGGVIVLGLWWALRRGES